MTEMVRMMTADEYFKKYAVNGIGKGADKRLIKSQMIDDFRKEIFGLIAMRGKKEFNGVIPDKGNPEAIRIAANVIRDEMRKWKKLCDMFARYRETIGLIMVNDIEEVVQEYDLGAQDTHEKHGV